MAPVSTTTKKPPANYFKDVNFPFDQWPRSDWGPLDNFPNTINQIHSINTSTHTKQPDDSTSTKYLLPPPVIMVSVAIIALLLCTTVIIMIVYIFKKRKKHTTRADSNGNNRTLSIWHTDHDIHASQSQGFPRPSVLNTGNEHQVPAVPCSSASPRTNNEFQVSQESTASILSSSNVANEYVSLQKTSSIPCKTDRSKNYLHQHIDDLIYDPSYEIAKTNLEKGKKLDHGNFGVVYEAVLVMQKSRHTLGISTKKKIAVVIKTPRPGLTQNDTETRLTVFKSELKLMIAVGSHPNLVLLIGAVTRNTDEMYIVMQKCAKGDLLTFLRAQKRCFISQFNRQFNLLQTDSFGYLRPNGKITRAIAFLPVTYEDVCKHAKWKPDLGKNISTAHLFSFAMQIAQGMEYLISVKCIHRDLAARNILITPEGLCKIADFGLAKRIVYREYYRTRTLKELPHRWMAVESFESTERKFTVQSDIWAYGILLYEIFTLGEIPYPTLEIEDVEAEVINGTRNTQPEHCPDEIYHLMKRCWSVEREKRPPFAESAELMKKHMSAASKEVEQNLNEERERETRLQNQLEMMRFEARRRESSDNSPETSPGPGGIHESVLNNVN